MTAGSPSDVSGSVPRRLAQQARQFWHRWLSRRLPPAATVTLDHSKLFVMPTRAGYGFLLVVLLLWLLGTNYENNLVLALAFLLIGLFAILPVHTFANLSGLRLRRVETAPCFAGDYALAALMVEKSGQRCHEHVRVGWSRNEGARVDLVKAGENAQQVRIGLPLLKRGRVQAPRILIESHFPLGLFRCWSWVDLDVSFLVYPQPKSAGPLPYGAAAGEGELEQVYLSGGDDFGGLKAYQPGDSLRHVAWKQYAGGRDLYSKEYVTGSDARLWLDWDLLVGRDVETRLSNLCAWVLEAERMQVPYGLRMPGHSIEPALGTAHKHRVLEQLALFPVHGVSQ